MFTAFTKSCEILEGGNLWIYHLQLSQCVGFVWVGMLNTGSWRATCVNALHIIQSWVASWSLGRSNVFWIKNRCWYFLYGVLWSLWLSRHFKRAFWCRRCKCALHILPRMRHKNAADGVVVGHWMQSAVEKWSKRWHYFSVPEAMINTNQPFTKDWNRARSDNQWISVDANSVVIVLGSWSMLKRHGGTFWDPFWGLWKWY